MSITNILNFENSNGTIGRKELIQNFLESIGNLAGCYLVEYYDGFDYKQSFIAKLSITKYGYDTDDFTIGFIEQGSRHRRSRQLDYYKLKSITLIND